jgi:hypothetical protein
MTREESLNLRLGDIIKSAFGNGSDETRSADLCEQLNDVLRGTRTPDAIMALALTLSFAAREVFSGEVMAMGADSEAVN